MPRSLSAGVIAELTASVVRPRFLVEITTNSTTLRFWTGSNDLIWGGYTWSAGYLKEFGSVTSSTDLGADGMWVELAGEVSTLLASALLDIRQNRAFKFYLGFLSATEVLVVDPYLLFEGLVDTVEIADGVEESTIRINIENKLINFERQKEFRYNHETQQLFYPGDLGFEYVEQLEDWSGYWGRPQKNKKKRKKKK
ncbi:conserved hypothetical protein [Gammaproteobacteria bacterium]